LNIGVFDGDLLDVSQPVFPFGEWWVDDSGQFHDASDIDQSFDDVFLNHLGQVRLKVTQVELTVCWNTRCAELSAIDTIVDRLGRAASYKSIRLCFFYFGWVEETYTDIKTALSRMLEIQAHKDVEVIDTNMMIRQSLENIEEASPIIKKGYDFWARSNGEMAKLPNEAVAKYLPRLVMFRHDPYDNKLLYFWVGNDSLCTKVYGRDWAKSAIGTDAAQSSAGESKTFAERVNAHYDHVMKTGQPTFHHVRWLLNDGETPPRWQSYERLMTRHTLHSGGYAIAVLSNETQNLGVSLAGRP
jgi:hypothetical protein